MFYCLCKSKVSLWKHETWKYEIMETLALTSFHGSSETLHLQGCRTADPCIRKVRYDTVVHFILNFMWICLNAVWILITKRLKWRLQLQLCCKDKMQPRKLGDQIGDRNSAYSIAKIFDSDNEEVELMYHHQSSNY